jgi:hypothetical protein
VRKNIVFVLLLVLLGVLGVSLYLGAGKTRAAALALIEDGAAPPPSARASSSAAHAAPSASAPASGSAAPEPKPPVDRSLSVIGPGWDLLAPALLAAEGVKSSASGAFGALDVKVSITVASSMSDIERGLASGGAANNGADVAVLPLSELVGAFERLRALDLRVFYVSGWSQGRDSLTGTPLPKLPSSGTISVEYVGGLDALSLPLLTLDLAGTSLERVKVAEHAADALLHSRSGGAEQDAAKQEDLVVSTREAARLLPYVLVAPRPLIEDRELILAAFVQGWLAGTDSLLKDRAKAARTLAALEGAPDALNLLHSLGDMEPIRLHENAALLGLSGRGAVSIESLIDWQFRARRAAHLGRGSTPDVSLVDGRVVTRLVRSQPKLVQASESPKRKASAAGAVALLEHGFAKDDEPPIIEALGLLAAVFPRHDVRLTLSGRPAKIQAEWLDRAATRYDLERGRSLVGSVPNKPGRAALLEVLRAP